MTDNAKPVSPDDFFFIASGTKGKLIRLNFMDIIYIQGLKNYVIIFTSGGDKKVTYLTMTEIETALPPAVFMRIHKSFIINVTQIKSVEGNTVIVYDSSDVPVGAFYRATLMNFINSKSVLSRR